MLRFLCQFAIVLVALTPVAAYGAAPVITPQEPEPLSDEQMAEIVDFIVGNAVFTLYHQAGHMLAEHYGVGGDTERDADRFATITLLEPRSGAGDQTLVDAIDEYRLSSQDRNSFGDADLSLPDRHALDGARAMAIACDMVGDDPEGFADIAEAMAIDAPARAACQAGWTEALAAWRRAAAKLLRPAGQPGAPLAVLYDPPLDEDVAEATILQDNHVLEEVAAKLGETYDLPAPPIVRATHCGGLGSRYDAARNELVLCYELSAAHGQLILHDIENRG